MMLLWARMTEVSMSMGWYLIPLSSMASSRAPTTNRASCLSVGGKKQKLSGFCDQREFIRGAKKQKRTPVCVCELSAAEETQVARPSPDGLRVSKTKPGVEVVGLQHLLAVAAVVAAAVVSAVHPDLQDGASACIQKNHRRNRRWKKRRRRGEVRPLRGESLPAALWSPGWR